MPNWAASSSASAPCRLEWRPSRWQLAAQTGLGLLAAWAPWLSELPSALRLAGSASALLWSAVLLWREARRPSCAILIPPLPDRPARVDGRPAVGVQVHWRGPLTFLAFRLADGRRQVRVFWPDTLDPVQRRELRLAVAARGVPPATASVAP